MGLPSGKKNGNIYNPWDYPLVNIQETSNNYGKSPFVNSKINYKWAMFNSYVTNYQRIYPLWLFYIAIEHHNF